MRLDKLLLEKGLVRSRTRAQELIKAGKVKVAGVKSPNPSTDVPAEANITLTEQDHPYVSRAAFKLVALLQAGTLNLRGRVVIDIGASHGGFTQVALLEGAKHVYAVDVGTGQLDGLLRENPAVTSLEQTDARTLNAETFSPAPDTMVCDVSFISATKLVPHVLRTFPTIADVALLVKPQFELQPEDIGPGGVVRDKQKIAQALASITACFEAEGFAVVAKAKAPGRPGGNKETMLHAVRTAKA